MLEARNISVKYGSRLAVSEVSLTLPPHEVTTIIGPNGAGKSTTLRTLNDGIGPFPVRSFLIHDRSILIRGEQLRSG